MRPTPCSSGRHGRTAKVDGSGIAIMSDSSMALKPVIEEPSKPMPFSNASSSSAELMLNDLSCPRMSVNQRRMKRSWCSSTIALTSSTVRGWSVMARDPRGSVVSRRSEAGRRCVEPAAPPGLQRGHRRFELPALVSEGVAGPGGVGAGDDAALLELLQAPGEQPVGDVRDRAGDVGEADRLAGPEQDLDDRAGPALAEQLDGAVVVRARGRQVVGGGGRAGGAPRGPPPPRARPAAPPP